MCNYYEEDQKWEDFHDRMRMIRAYLDEHFQLDYTRIAMVRPTYKAPDSFAGPGAKGSPHGPLRSRSGVG